ncbi:MAG: metallophosphoesterase [Thaumarchaeota archaeon]|nr:metallophosphoesterase [Nitrososphaerota archaeon]
MAKKSRLFFVTDIHGSDRCFRKFLNAANFYKAEYLILGGDITGKIMVPIVEEGPGRWTADYLGDQVTFSKEEKIAEFEKNLAEGGIYSIRLAKNQFSEIQSNKAKIDEVFAQAMKDSLERWMKLADERLKESGAKCYISVGNDDDFIVDDTLKAHVSENVIYCEEEIVEIAEHEMLSLGTSNRTPWNSPREADEETLKKKLDHMASKMKDLGNSIFSVHVPPIESGIDAAPQIDESFKPVMKGGHPVMIPAGSSAVRQAIQSYQPILGLHGHIHESRGIYKLGRTVCINPGSEYGQGILRGAIVDMEEKKLSDYLLVSG